MFRAFPTLIALVGVLVCQMTSLGHQHDEVTGNHASQPHFHWQIKANENHDHADSHSNSHHSHHDESDPLTTPSPADGHDSDAVYLAPGNGNFCLRAGTSTDNLTIEIASFDQFPIQFEQLISVECRRWTDSNSLGIFDCPAYLRLQNFRI